MNGEAITKLRCSALDRFFHCPSSAMATEAPINQSTPIADIGHAAHELFAGLVMGEDIDADALARVYQCDVSELEMLLGRAKNAWEQVRKYFPQPRAEVRLEGLHTTGTADVLHNDGETLAVLDWKSGYSGTSHIHQLMGYADAARRMYGMPTSGKVMIVEVWVRLGQMQIEEFSEADLDAFSRRWEGQAKQIGKTWSPGEHCNFCHLMATCQARRDYIHSAAETLGGLQIRDDQMPTRERLGELYSLSRDLQKALMRYDKALNAELKKGPIAVSDKKELAQVEGTNTTIDPRVAWHILADEYSFDEDALASVLTVTKTNLVKALRFRAPKGQKGQWERECLKLIEDAGGITRETYTRRIVRDKTSAVG